MSIEVIVHLAPPRRMTEAERRAAIDREAEGEYRALLREEIDKISQLCAQRAFVREKTITVPEPPREPGEPEQPDGADPRGPALVQVHFPHGSAVPLSTASWIAIAKRLHAERPGAAVHLDGHASSVGADAVNLRLSRARVKAVREALKVIPDLRVVDRGGAEGHGEADAMATEDGKTGAALAEARDHNRRVDITFVD